jgi:CubicO group peptidase (beta-lactamase class C family)
MRVMFALLAVAGIAVAPAAASADWATFEQRIEQYVAADEVVGASAVFVQDGRVVERFDHGFADRAAERKVDAQTIFHWASITKTLTAISILQLRDRGKLTLDDPIVRWVPELRAIHDPYDAIDHITIRMLLSHTAGFQDPTWPYSQGRDWEPFEPTSWQQLVAMMPYQKLEFEPGSRYGYSNPAFIYLARVIEQVSGDPWDAYVAKNIFAPLGMDRSYFRNTPYFLEAHRSHGYTRRDGKLIDGGADFDPGITSPNGAWNAPVDDVVKFVAFLTGAVTPGMSRERYDVVLSRKSLAEMWQAVKPMKDGYEAAPGRSMGLSFFVIGDGDERVLGHTGIQAGYRSFVFFRPENAAAVITVFNTTNEDSPAQARAAEERLQQAALALLR